MNLTSNQRRAMRIKSGWDYMDIMFLMGISPFVVIVLEDEDDSELVDPGLKETYDLVLRQICYA